MGLEARRLFSALLIAGTAGTDTISVSLGSDGTLHATVNGTTTNYAPAQYAGGITIDTNLSQAAADQVTVSGLPAVATTIQGSRQLAVTLGTDSRGLQDIAGPVTVTSPTSDNSEFITLNIDDAGDPVARHATCSTSPTLINGKPYDVLHGISAADIMFSTFDVQADNLTTGTGADTIDVSTAVATTLTNLFVNGSGTHVNAIESSPTGLPHRFFNQLAVNGRPGTTSLSVTEMETASFMVSTFAPVDTVGVVSWGLNPDDKVSFTAAAIASPVTVDPGFSANTILVSGTPVNQTGIAGGPTIDINGGSGADTLSVFRVDPGTTVNFDGHGGPDVVNSFSVGAGPTSLGTVNLIESQGQTALTLDDRSDTAPRQVIMDTFAQSGTTWGTVQGLGLPTFNFVAAATTSIAVKGAGTAPVDSLVVNHTPGGGPISFTGMKTAEIDGTAPGQQLGLSGTSTPMDLLTVDFSGGGISSGTVIDADTSAARIIGASASDPFTLSNGVARITRLGATVNLNAASLQSLDLEDGTFDVTGPIGSISLLAGPLAKVILHSGAQLAGLSIDASGAVTLAPASSASDPNRLTVAGALSVAGRLDLTNNALLWNYVGADPVAQLRAWVRSGLSGSAGIGSSLMDVTHGLAIADAADGSVALPANTLEVRWSRFGDANLDGVVNFADLLVLAQNYGRTGDNWDQGDFTYDGKIDFADLLKLGQNYGGTLQSAAAAAPLVIAQLARKTSRRTRFALR